MSKSSWDKGFTSGAKAARKVSANSVCTICCDGCKEHGERVERERIIKLFEDIKNEPSRKSENWLHKVARTAYTTAAIALIKGEQK
jgi:hypothetical protein